jgi:hypothetical protein
MLMLIQCIQFLSVIRGGWDGVLVRAQELLWDRYGWGGEVVIEEGTVCDHQNFGVRGGNRLKPYLGYRTWHTVHEVNEASAQSSLKTVGMKNDRRGISPDSRNSTNLGI